MSLRRSHKWGARSIVVGAAFGAQETAGAAWVVLPDSPAWDLREGSIDLWVRPGGVAGTILSRDAHETALPGHLTVVWLTDGIVGVRIQGDADHFVCATGVEAGAWSHLGINLGPPQMELYVNGRPTTYTGPTEGVPSLVRPECGAAVSTGIDGNDNPITLGVASFYSSEGTADRVDAPFAAGAIDRLRISEVRRDFSVYGE